MLRIVFMGTPEFAVPTLRALMQAEDVDVVGVYTQPDRPVGRGLELKASPVKELALEYRIPVFQPEKLSAVGEFEKLAELQPDLIVVAAFGQILRRNVLDLPRLGCINVHSSLLPRWRGAAPIQWAILEGDLETGVTIQRMAEKLDAGEILLQGRTPISDSETAGTLHDRLSQIGAPLVLEAIRGLSAGTLLGQPQDESQVTYASKLSKEMEGLDAEGQNAQVLDRRIRALNPWPGTSVWVDSPHPGREAEATRERLKIRAALCHPELNGKRGHLTLEQGKLLLGTSDGVLVLRLVQWDGKKAMTPEEFLNGLRGRGQALPLRVWSKPT